jgi:type I restriction enzyme S subunit
MRSARLGDVTVSMKNGLYKPATEYGDDGTPCLRMYNIDAGSIVWRDIRRMRISAAEFEDYRLREGDLLVNRVNSRELVGKAAYIPASLEPSIFESKNIRVRLDTSKVLPKFINYQLLFGSRRYFAGNAQQVVGMASISQQQLADFPIVMADLDAQHCIVAELEKQFSRLDEAVANLKRVKANLKRYKAAVLKAAVEGRLVPTEAELARQEGRTFETADEQLVCLHGARKDGRAGGVSGRARASEVASKLPALPAGWCWSDFEAVADRVTVGHVGPMKGEYVAEGIPFLRSQNVRPNRYDPEGLKFISLEFHAKLQKSALQPGDIVVVRSGSVGVACVIPESLPVANCSDLVIIKRPRGVLPGYGAFYLNAVVDSRIAAGRVGVALAHFNTKSVAKLPVPVPPIAEQVRIVLEVDRRFSVAATVETEVDLNLERARSARQALLRTMFSGQASEARE